MTQSVPSAEQRTAGINAFLYAVLRGDGRLHRLRAELREPQSLQALPGKLGADESDAGQVINLVQLAVRARPAPEVASLLPARYHVFACALEGAFVCLNRSDPRHAEEGKPRFFLTRYENCPHCGQRVFELATCPRCGTAYLVGHETYEYDQGNAGPRMLHHPLAAAPDAGDRLSYYVLSGNV